MVFLYFFCQRWYAWRGIPYSSALAVVPAALVAFGPLFWQYHTQAEVFSMSNMLIAVQLYLLQRLRECCYRPGCEGGILPIACLGAFCLGLGPALLVLGECVWGGASRQPQPRSDLRVLGGWEARREKCCV